MATYTLDFDTLGLSPEEVLREMGYTRVMPEKEVTDTLHALFSDVAALARPSCTFRLFGGSVEQSAVALESATLHVGDVIARLLEGSERFALFAATAGNAFQDYQDRVKAEGDMLRIFILDTIGSCLAEKAGDRMETLLEQELAGCRHSFRFSPGYCGWPLKEQKEVFSLLGGNPCDIRLSDVCLMQPIKSISGIIGIGEKIKNRKYGCDICQLETCYKRKNKKKKDDTDK